MKHFLYVGHFKHDGRYLELTNSRSDPTLRPVVARPLDMAVVQQVFRDITQRTDFAIPREWCLWIAEAGYIACNPYARSPQAIHFIVELAKRTLCEVWEDFIRPIPLDEVVYQWGSQPAAVPGATAPPRPSAVEQQPGRTTPSV